MKKTILITASFICLAAAGTAIAGPLDFWRPKGKDAQLVQKVRDSRQVLIDLTSTKGKDIPKNLLKDAEAVLIFSDSVRAGLFVTGQFAQGVALVRKGSGDWSPPAFFRMSGVGIGIQIGGEVSDVVFVLNDKDGVEQLLQHHFTMGADASAAAGKKGRQVKASSNARTGMLAYGRSKGLFAGMSFDGSVVKQDDGANEKYYGKKLSARDILLDNRAPKTPEASDLIAELKRHD